MKYVLITPARNEERFITKTLDSMVAQTLLPERWVIVDDGSSDRTAEIVERYAAHHFWIELVRRPQHLDRSFAGKVHAFNAGLERARSLQFEVIGNLDADLSFEADYLEFLMRKFSQDPKLGVAGRLSPKTVAMTQPGTVSRVRTMLLVAVNFSGGSVFRTLVVMSPIGREALTGSRSRQRE